ncbi:hypothetical protein B0H19DRAFT_1098799 [Mycena capillaripes]|nr:hypothetical protein B0H19DRAFT_1098799 [Mycena capillaripes]
MRFSTTLFVLSAAATVFAKCAICPKEVTLDNVMYHLELNQATSDGTACGYLEKGHKEIPKEGLCLYNGMGKLEPASDKGCPDEVPTKKC